MITTFTTWRKSSRSTADGADCVEVSPGAPGELVGIRDSKQESLPERPVLVFAASHFAAVMAAIKNGQLDGC